MTTKILYEFILTRFSCPMTLITNQGVHFINNVIKHMIDHFLLKHVNSTTYYPQGNGLVESTNKFIVNLIIKLMNENKKNQTNIYLLYFSFVHNNLQGSYRVNLILVSVWNTSFNAHIICFARFQWGSQKCKSSEGIHQWTNKFKETAYSHIKGTRNQR